MENNMGTKQLTKWERFEHVSRILQLVILIIGVAALYQIHSQIKQARQATNKSSFDILWQLDTRLRERPNAKIYIAIQHDRPIITKKITEDDLDVYLSDLSFIEDAYTRGLISIDDIYEWFSACVISTYENKEIKAYLAKLQKIDPQSYHAFVDLYKRVHQYGSFRDKIKQAR